MLVHKSWIFDIGQVSHTVELEHEYGFFPSCLTVKIDGGVRMHQQLSPKLHRRYDFDVQGHTCSIHIKLALGLSPAYDVTVDNHSVPEAGSELAATFLRASSAPMDTLLLPASDVTTAQDQLLRPSGHNTESEAGTDRAKG